MFQGVANTTETGPDEDEWKRSTEVLTECAVFAKEQGIKLAIEPLNRFEAWLINTMEAGYKYVTDIGIDSIGILADTHHSNIEEYNTAKAWEKAIDKIYHVHISENNRGIPGRGHAIDPEIFAVLKRGNYEGYLIVELLMRMYLKFLVRLEFGDLL